MSLKPRVLFVCAENSCRSQMAEGFAAKLGKGVLEVWSAGSKPSGKVNAAAVALMKEKGIDISDQHSKGLDELPTGRWDFIVTMGCGDACPSLPADRRLDWDLRDPKGLPPEEFRRVRDDIEKRVIRLINAAKRGTS